MTQTPEGATADRAPVGVVARIPDRDPYLKRSEVAARLRVSTRTLSRWCSGGFFPKGVRVFGRVLWRESLVESWRREREASHA